MINEIGGNGGGIFRRMYGNFLIESADLLNSEILKDLGMNFIDLSYKWDEIGYTLLKVFEKADRTLLRDISVKLNDIFVREEKLFSNLKKCK